MRTINPADLVPMDIFVDKEPITIDLVYAQADHPRNIFGEAIYQPSARFWAHKDLALITLLAARLLNDQHGYKLKLKDCLRTVDAQAAMQKTNIVKAHPEWCVEGPSRLLAPPGHGAHPRSMAIDVCVLNKNGQEVDMGTPFDHMDETSARAYTDFPEPALTNRRVLEESFVKSAEILNMPFLPLPSEWWDFRFPPETYNQFSAISDSDLPPQMQLSSQVANNIPDFDATHFQRLADSLIHLIDKHHGSL